MKLEDAAILAALLAGAVLLVWELRSPARAFEEVRGWRLKGGVFFVLMMVIGGAVPALLQPWLHPFRLFDASQLGTLGGAVLGLFAADLLTYWMHRGYHRFDLGWRFFHQLHHSAERVDLPGLGYAHPSENVLNTTLNCLLFNVVLGLSAQSSALAGAFTLFLGLLQHSNVRTPRWLGYLVQRPEQHCVHHERGVHALNYANFPVFDLVFGTFKNPSGWQGVAGFHSGASQQVWGMLVGRDVSNAQSTRNRAVEQSNRQTA